MDIKTVKLELMQRLLETESEEILARMQNIFKKEREYTLDHAEQKMLDDRKQRHLDNEGKSYTWDEVKARSRKASFNAN